ncbi:MAG: hypothetical protein Tsb002_04760 [Wenzhouxiangellaceae bacterium]
MPVSIARNPRTDLPAIRWRLVEKRLRFFTPFCRRGLALVTFFNSLLLRNDCGDSADIAAVAPGMRGRITALPEAKPIMPLDCVTVLSSDAVMMAG